MHLGRMSPALILMLTLATGPTAAEQQAARETAQAEYNASLKPNAAREQASADAVDAEAEVEAMREKCGDAFGKIKVGMSLKRFKACVEILEVKYRDEVATVYEVEAGYVRTERGKVTRWLAK